MSGLFSRRGVVSGWAAMNKILLDIDGVVADFTGHLLRELHKAGHPLFADEHLNEWDLKRCLPEKMHGDLTRIMSRPGFFAAIPEYTGAHAFVHRLKCLGSVTALTTCTGYAAIERKNWLLNRWFYPSEIAIVARHEDKHCYSGDVIIEDRLETLLSWPQTEFPLAYGTGIRKILFDRPWNQGTTRGIHRVRSYNEVIAACTD